MQILLLGTGAAHGIPAFSSESRVSRYAREHGGKDVRTRTAALIDGILKIDLPPDTLTQVQREGLDVRDWIALIFTHSHDDHFAPSELQYCVIPFNDRDHLDFSIYGNARIVDELWTRYPNWPFDIHPTTSFEPFSIADYRIVPFKANHKLDEDSQNFVIEREGKKLIYATDTGVIFPESMDFLAGAKADCLIIECTEGFVPTQYHGHLDIHECRQMVEALRKNGALQDRARVVTVHHADQGEGTHDELTAAFAPDGIEVGYDGMVIDLAE